MTAQKKQLAAVPDAELPAAIADEEEFLLRHAGAGYEETVKESFAIPRLECLQYLSPQTMSKKAEYVQGALPGMILNSVTLELMTECRVIPIYYNMVQLEWTPREKKGGLVAIHPFNTPLAKQTKRDDRGQNVLPNGNILNDTRQHFVLLLKDNNITEPCVISMKSTQIKYSTRWLTYQTRNHVLPSGRLLTEPPSFMFSYHVTSQEETNDQGSWYSWKITDRQPVHNPVLKIAHRAYEKMRISGADVQVNYDEETTAGPADTPEDLDNDLDA